MRYVIQQSNGTLYFGRGRKWTLNPKDALAFVNETRARDFARYNRLGDTRVTALGAGAEPPVTTGVPRAPATLASTPESNLEPMKSTSTAKPAPRPERRTARKPGAAPAPASATPRTSTLRRTQRAAAPATPSGSPPADMSANVPPTAAPNGQTIVEARIDVGYGSALFIRGEGGGLSWDAGVPLTCIDPTTWRWSAPSETGSARFKLLLDDRTWCQGDDLTVEAGRRIEVLPVF